MKNPVIVGDIKELKVDKMFQLMKRIMEQNKSILITSNIKKWKYSRITRNYHETKFTRSFL